MKNTKKLLSLLLVIAMIFALAVPAFAEGETPSMAGKTVIVHSNDVHGAIAGYANMAALAAEYESQGAKVIVADAGDFSQGKVEVSSNKGLNAVKMMDAAGYDVATLGNHEFDYGYAQLKENLKEATFSTICCNILDENGKPAFEGSKVFDIDGLKVGFIGVNTPESQTKANPALIKGLTWLAGDDMVKAVQAEADKLKADGTDVIVVLSHLGVDSESKPNRSTDLWAGLKGVDFIIDGHSHTVMEKGDNNEPIQSTGTAFDNIGVIVIDNATKKIEKNMLVKVTADSAKDEAVAKAAQDITDAINAEYGAVFAKSEVELNGDRSYNTKTDLYGNRDGETNLGDLITDSMVWSVKKTGGVTVDEKNIVAVTNGGGIRAAIKAGDVTKKDVNTVLPFGNTIAVVYVTGAELLEALEASTYCSPSSAIGGFPQVSGINYTVDASKAYDANDTTYPGSTYYGPKTINRVTIDSINGQAFDAKATYAVITNNFLAAGGDTYYAFASASAQFDTGIPLDEALMDYITTELKGVIGEQYKAPQGRVSYTEPFTDVTAGVYHDAIMWAYKSKITTGVTKTTFEPNSPCTRAQIVTFLYRAAGSPEVAENVTNPFTDVSKDSVYYNAIMWAVEKKITTGVTDTTFEPNSPCTRAQIVTFLYREAGSPELAKDAANPFSDVSDSSVYYNAILWAVEKKITTGVTGTTFVPNDTCTRAQAVTFLFRAK